MSWFNHFFSTLGIHHRAPTQKRGIMKLLWDYGSVLRCVLCLVRPFLRRSLVTEALRDGAQCPVTGGDGGDVKKPRCAALSLRRLLQQPLHHCHTTIHRGTAPAKRPLHVGLRVRRGLCVATKEPVRDALEDGYRCTNVQKASAPPASLWWHVHIFLNSLKALRDKFYDARQACRVVQSHQRVNIDLNMSI